MKINKQPILILIIFLVTAPIAFGQGFMNKIKSKAQQEVKSEINKLEKGNSSSPANKNKLSSNVTRTVAASLKADEIFDYGENCIDLGASLNQVSFISSQRVGDSYKCFAYKNGARTPVACPTNFDNCSASLQCSYSKLIEMSLSSDEIKKYVTNQTEDHSAATPTISDEQMKMMSAYMTKEQLETVKKQMAGAAKQTQGQTYSTVTSSSLTFNGKSYGPYKQIVQFFLTQDQKNFYAVIMEDGQKAMEQHYKIITSASSITLTSPGMMPPTMCFVASDNSEFGMYVNDNQGKFKIITSSGKSYDVNRSTAISNIWYSAAGNHLNYLATNQLFHDGQLIKTFDSNNSIDPCNLFVSADGKGITMIKDNVISFADGDYFEYPLKTALVKINGKAYFKWLAMENREVVVYQKPF
jgi:hypothetical protein